MFKKSVFCVFCVFFLMLARLRSEYANLIQRIHRILFADFQPKITNNCQFSFWVNTMNTIVIRQRIHKRLILRPSLFVKVHKSTFRPSFHVSCITFAYTVIHSLLYQICSIEQINQLHDLLHEVYKNECPSTDTLNYIFYNQSCPT